MESSDSQYEEKFVIAIDVGSTMSAVAYCHVHPSDEPEAVVISRWPGQSHALGDCKVPTRILYDENGQASRFGANISSEDLLSGRVASRFKLLLHPREMRAQQGITPPELPRNVTIFQVYTDYIRFLFEHARAQIKETTIDLDHGSLFDRFKDDFIVCLAIPNGWDGKQQDLLRRAVVAAKILPADHEQGRLEFVSEGESSVHFASSHRNFKKSLREGLVFSVCDIGGSTVDTTVYRCVSVTPKLQLKEVTWSECVQAGGIFVDQAAEKLVTAKLSGSSLDRPSTLALILADFERNIKRSFDGSADVKTIQLMGLVPDDNNRDISGGQLKLRRDELEQIFRPSFVAIAESLDAVLGRAKQTCEIMLLVGGFGESPYLKRRITEHSQKWNMRVIPISEATDKAAVKGAALWRAKQIVVARAARSTYGISADVYYDSNSPIHVQRQRLFDNTFRDGEGRLRIRDAFNALVIKNQIVEHTETIAFPFRAAFHEDLDKLPPIHIPLYRVDALESPAWVVDEKGRPTSGLREVYSIRIEPSEVRRYINSSKQRPGRFFGLISRKAGQRQFDFNIELYFGQTSLVAYVTWKEHGTKHKSNVSVIHNSIATT